MELQPPQGGVAAAPACGRIVMKDRVDKAYQLLSVSGKVCLVCSGAKTWRKAFLVQRHLFELGLLVLDPGVGVGDRLKMVLQPLEVPLSLADVVQTGVIGRPFLVASPQRGKTFGRSATGPEGGETLLQALLQLFQLVLQSDDIDRIVHGTNPSTKIVPLPYGTYGFLDKETEGWVCWFLSL